MLLALFVLLIPASVAQTMQSLSAQIVDVTSCALMQLSYADCSAKCLSIPGCMIAYMENNDGNCFLCPYGVITTLVTDTSNTADLEIKCDNCTSTASTYGGHVTVNSVDQYYYFTSTAGGWSITEDNGCVDSTWKRFSRVLGPWCILPYFSTTMYNWYDASVHCNSIGAVLSGMETVYEYNYVDQSIRSAFTNQFSSTTPVQGLWWMGGVLRPACTLPAWNTTICNGTSTPFYWTDSFTTGTTLLQRLTTSGTLTCVAAYESNYGWYLDGWMDQIDCMRGETSWITGYGHACGMKARH